MQKSDIELFHVLQNITILDIFRFARHLLDVAPTFFHSLKHGDTCLGRRAERGYGAAALYCCVLLRNQWIDKKGTEVKLRIALVFLFSM